MSTLIFDLLNSERLSVFSELKKLPKGGILGGGTALALQIGHRKSYDFDLFYQSPIQRTALLRVREVFASRIATVVHDTPDELSFIVQPDILITLLYYPFPGLHKRIATTSLPLFHICDIATSKAYAVGRRGVWRDYVDLYFLLRDHMSLESIIREAQQRFQGLFSAKLFLQQLQYFDDIEDFSSELIPKNIGIPKIKQFLLNKVRDYVSSITG